MFDPTDVETYRSPTNDLRMMERKQRRRLEATAADPTADERWVATICLGLAALSTLSLPALVAKLLLISWIGLLVLLVHASLRASARRALGRPSVTRPPLGRYGWKALVVAAVAAVAPLPMAILMGAHLPLLSREAAAIEADSFHARSTGQFVGLIWVEVDRCPHATYFIAPQQGNPFAPAVTLVHQTSAAPCEFGGGYSLWPSWRIKMGTGRGRLPSRM